MAKQSISISVETELLEALDQELSHKAHRQQNRSAAVAEALELWLQARRLAALRQAYRELGQLEGGDLEAAGQDAVAMGNEALDREAQDTGLPKSVLRPCSAEAQRLPAPASP